MTPPAHAGGGARARTTGLASRAAAASIAATLAAVSAPSSAQPAPAPDAFRLSYAPHAFHRKSSDEHVKWNHFVALEYLTPRWTIWGADRAIVGFAAGDNSFGQFSQYAFVGQEWDLWRLGPGRVFANVTAGLLHGYRDPYQDKIPFNRFGTAPVVVPGAGWRTGRFAIGANLLGANGVMVFGAVSFDVR